MNNVKNEKKRKYEQKKQKKITEENDIHVQHYIKQFHSVVVHRHTIQMSAFKTI